MCISCMCPGGFTRHISCYATASTKSVEKGLFSALRRRRRFPSKRGVFSASIAVSPFRVLNHIIGLRRLGYKFHVKFCFTLKFYLLVLEKCYFVVFCCFKQCYIVFLLNAIKGIVPSTNNLYYTPLRGCGGG